MISLVVGLGNIGEQYQGTRHNVGMETLALISRSLDTLPQPSNELYDWSLARQKGKDIILMSPRTYMNRSGLAVQAILGKTGLLPEQMLVLVDDFNLPLGKIRIRKSGSDGGHNGLASIIEAIGTEAFPRLRLGIGPVPENTTTTDFVLGRFRPEEEEQKQKMLAFAAEAVMFAIHNRLDEVMNKYNVNPV